MCSDDARSDLFDGIYVIVVVCSSRFLELRVWTVSIDIQKCSSLGFADCTYLSPVMVFQTGQEGRNLVIAYTTGCYQLRCCWNTISQCRACC